MTFTFEIPDKCKRLGRRCMFFSATTRTYYCKLYNRYLPFILSCNCSKPDWCEAEVIGVKLRKEPHGDKETD